MLRALVALLLVANLGFWAWRTGALEGLGLGPARERDPTRLAQQIRPEAVRVLPASAAIAVSIAASADASTPSSAPPLLCLEAGPFEPLALEAAERALISAGLSEGSWLRSSQETAAQFAVVLGPFSGRDALLKKREEIGRLRLPLEALELPADGASAAPQPGLALGRYDTRNAADAALASFSQRGVRTARVAVVRQAGSASRLRIESATTEQAERLRAIGGGALGAAFAPCATALAAPR